MPTRAIPLLLLLSLALCTAPSVGAQSPAAALDEVLSRHDGTATVRAQRTTDAITLDGRVDEPVYTRLPHLTGFLQQEPNEGAPGTEQTEAWVLYDDRNIYISARLHDSQPNREIVTEMRRDGQGTNDNESFGVVFDTFDDRRNGYVFQVSLAGGLYDGYVTDERDMNRDWNTVWDARTQRTPDGWTVEMAIPFKSLRFPDGAHDWGINLKRVVKWKNEVQYLTRIPASLGRRGINKLSSAGTLVGLETPKSGRTFELKPYGSTGFTTDHPAGGTSQSDAHLSWGADGKVGLTDGLTADVTYNTDFAQVEEDEQQVNLTRFSTVFPEKREFFLEGSGIFSFGGLSNQPRGGSNAAMNNTTNPIVSDVPVLFFSRRIGLDGGKTVPIDVGGRITGKQGAYSIGVLDIRTGDVASGGIPSTNFGVVRVKRDILRRSAVGFIVTDRSVTPQAAGHGQSYGVDGVFSFFQNLNINTYLAATDNPGVSGHNTSYRAQVDYNADRYGLQIERLATDRNFSPQVGFMSRTSFIRNTVYTRFSPRMKGRAVRKWIYDAQLDYITNPSGRLQSRALKGGWRAELQNSDTFAVEGARSFESFDAPYTVSPGVVLPVGTYHFGEVRAFYNFGPQRPVSANVELDHGQFYNGHRTALTMARGRLQLRPQVSLEPGVTVNHVTLPSGNFTSVLATTRGTITVTPRLSASALFQLNTSTKTLNSNIRFRWEYRPGSDLFVVLTDNRDTTASGWLPELRNRAFIVKGTRLFRF